MNRYGLIAGLTYAALFWALLFATVGATWLAIVAALCCLGVIVLAAVELADHVKTWDYDESDDWGYVERCP